MDPFTIGILVFLAATTLLFLFRLKIIYVMSLGLKLVFPLLLLLALSALFWTEGYQQLADNSLRQAGTYSSIQSFDDSITSITDVPGNIWEGIQDFFNNSNNQPSQSNSQPGPLELQFYPSLVVTLGTIYRIIALALSLIGMIVVLYLSYSTTGAAEVAKLRHDLHALSEKVDRLERKEATLPRYLP